MAVIVTYAMAVNVFFVLLELFTALYSGMPHHIKSFQYMYFGLDGANNLVPWMWTSAILSVFSLLLLLNPKTRKKETVLGVACVAVFAALWIEKGLALVITGFIPNPLGERNRRTGNYAALQDSAVSERTGIRLAKVDLKTVGLEIVDTLPLAPAASV